MKKIFGAILFLPILGISQNTFVKQVPTGTGAPVNATSPTLVTPNLGTPTTLVLTNATGSPTGITVAQSQVTSLVTDLSNKQPLSSNLTTYAGIAPSSNVQTLLSAADYAAFKTSLSLGNVTNESKSTMFTNATFTGTFATAAGAIGNASLANGAVANLSGTNTGDQTISDATITTTDITTNNFTTAKHGFVPKGTNVGNFLKDDGTWAAPSGSGDMVLASAQSVTGAKTFDKNKLLVKGTSTGTTNITTDNTSATDYTVTLPAVDITAAQLTKLTTSTSSNTASVIAERDANNNIAINNITGSYTTTATAAGTTTLTVGSKFLQRFTGATTQTVVMPDATTLTAGHQFQVTNNSTGLVTVNANGGGLIRVVLAGSVTIFTVTDISTSAGVWNISSSETPFTINVQALTSSPTDAQTIYFGTLPKAPTTTANISKIYVRQACKLTAAELYCYSGTAGTGESWTIYVRVNNTTDYTIAAVAAATSERVFSNTALNTTGIVLAAGDYVEIKSINPTWATNPLTTIFGGYLKFN